VVAFLYECLIEGDGVVQGARLHLLLLLEQRLTLYVSIAAPAGAGLLRCCCC
jgi:hypothetical protein